ncbi:MAG: DNA mismatch endonuclease Vsr [Bacteroidales bacterium]|nr:DNA mismatch endonuclease Vsr [Candidatus Sodaliphilus aphodohippi]
MDKMTPQQRHRCMSRIRSKDTKPEMVVRRYLWHHGYRYRLHRKGLAGRPDIVIGRLKVAIFVNGCFWHGHSCQTKFPRTNVDFWTEKIARNRERDYRNHADLTAQGWMVITLWECELKKKRLDETLHRLLNTLQLLEPVPPVAASPQESDHYLLAAEDEVPYGQ